MTAKIILLDGLAGTGKSSTGQKLYRIIKENDYCVDFIHEFNPSHPVSGANISDISEWHNQVINNWAKIIDIVRNNDLTFILDAAFLQYPIGELVEQGIDHDKIYDFIEKVTEMLMTVNPVLIYLRHKDIYKAITELYKRREITWQNKVCSFLTDTPYGQKNKHAGFELYLDFNRNLGEICDSFFANCNFNKFKFDLAAVCSGMEILEISNFLNLAPAAVKIDFTPYQGTYLEVGTDRQAVISLKDDMLEISGLFLIAKNLLPKLDDVFFVYGKPYELNFLRDTSGQIDGFRLSGFQDKNKNTRWRLCS